MSNRARRQQSGQAMVLVAVVIIALIGSTALVLLAGSVEWQKNEQQELADQAALSAASRIGISCNAASAAVIIRAADAFVAGRRARTSALAIAGGPCSRGYVGTATFVGPVTERITYPYRAHQQQIEVVLTVTVPISFGGVEKIPNTSVTRRALAQGPAALVAALTATTLDCQAGAQMNVQGSIMARNLITYNNVCDIFAHGRLDAASATWSDFGNVTVGRSPQAWVGAGGRCTAPARRAICADGYELSGANPTCAGAATEFQSAADRVLNPNPCLAGVNPLAAFLPPAANLPPEPNLDPSAVATLRNVGGGPLGAACNPVTVYPAIRVAGVQIGTGAGPVPVRDAAGFWHFRPSCYGYLDLSRLPGPNRRATFDPGFYYFNGTGIVPNTAGGLCLNANSQLVGRDVTIEFVGRANLYSGACNGGAGSGGTYGSNVPVDPPNNLRWLAAPCSTSPTAGDLVSCRGAASWCPVGDRACWNQLIWASAGISGRFQINSNAARAWMLGSVSWPGTCQWGPNGASAIDGAVSCGTFRFTAATSNQATIGGDFGVSTALTEASLIE